MRRGVAAFAAFVAAALAGAACQGEDPPSEPLRVAVAANFSATHQTLAARFTERTGHQVQAAVGSSGQLFAQIRNGAPFHVFLSADQERPAQLERDGRAAPGTRFSYAEGRLVLFGPGLDSVRAGGADLRREGYRVAVANPQTAPYGAAALDALSALGLEGAVAPRLVTGESVAQSEQFVRSRAAELGFVALAQVTREPASTWWLVPRALHRPILQDAVLLSGGDEHPAARAYLEFLRSDEARRIIEADGYGIPGAEAAGSREGADPAQSPPGEAENTP